MFRLMNAAAVLCTAELCLLSARATQHYLHAFRELRQDVLISPHAAVLKVCAQDPLAQDSKPIFCKAELSWRAQHLWVSPCAKRHSPLSFQIERYYRIELRCQKLQRPLLTAYVFR